MQIMYVGPHAAGVEVPESGTIAERDKPVDVPDDIAEGLLQQADNWQPVDAKKKGNN